MKISPSQMALLIATAAFALLLAACGGMVAPAASGAAPDANTAQTQTEAAPAAVAPVDPKNLETALFAGGCFWSMQRMMDMVPGVITTTVGYTGGHVENPTYEQVSSETTGHAEAVEVIFDTARLSYAELVDHFWHQIDPTTVDQQACDYGNSYRSGIFYRDAEQQKVAEASKQALEDSGRFNVPIVTEITAASTFYPAEEYHQKFYLKNPQHYNAYRAGCGRDELLVQIWGSAPD